MLSFIGYIAPVSLELLLIPFRLGTPLSRWHLRLDIMLWSTLKSFSKKINLFFMTILCWITLPGALFQTSRISLSPPFLPTRRSERRCLALTLPVHQVRTILEAFSIRNVGTSFLKRSLMLSFTCSLPWSCLRVLILVWWPSSRKWSI